MWSCPCPVLVPAAPPSSLPGNKTSPGAAAFARPARYKGPSCSDSFRPKPRPLAVRHQGDPSCQ